MAQQDQAQKCSNSGSFGKSSRKAKQKKVPQRGLGVAQLEKIRIEEEQRKEAEAASIFPTPSSSSSSSSVSPSKSCYLPLPPPTFPFSNHLSAIPCGSPADFTRLPLSLHNTDEAKASSTVFEASWHSNPVVHGHGNVPKLCDFEKEILSSMSLPFESNPTWLFQDWNQRTQQYQQQPCSSMVNVSSGTLSSSSSSLHDYSIIEPPSNQNYSSSCVPMKQEEKMMGLKRSYPFSLDVLSASSFNFKLPTFTTFLKTNETDSCGSGFDAASSTFRQVASCSTLNSKKSNFKQNENFNGDFLTLAPPTPPPSKFNSTSTFSALFHSQENHEFESPSSQGKLEDQIPHEEGHSHSQLNQPLHSFFPAKAATSSRVQNLKNGGNGESIDLNLKL